MNGPGGGGYSDPAYDADHLATFMVNKINTSTVLQDGMEKLERLEHSSGIWALKCKLAISSRGILVLEAENPSKMVDMFPMEKVLFPAAVTNHRPDAAWRNILMFIVLEDPRNHPNSPSEMHIFNCRNTSAQRLVDEINGMKNSKPEPMTTSTSRAIPEAYSGRPTELEQVKRSDFGGAAGFRRGGAATPAGGVLGVGGEDREDLAFVEADVKGLNGFIDEIEEFSGRVHARIAFQTGEGSNRRGGGSRSRPGDGLRARKAELPSQQEFARIFAAYKGAFNYLGRLTGRITEPNAPELVHFLFTPLAMTLDICRQEFRSIALAMDVLRPMLTREAVDLLEKCLSTKESNLWHSLGQAWTTPREQWDGYLPDDEFTSPQPQQRVVASGAGAPSSGGYYYPLGERGREMRPSAGSGGMVMNNGGDRGMPPEMSQKQMIVPPPPAPPPLPVSDRAPSINGGSSIGGPRGGGSGSGLGGLSGFDDRSYKDKSLGLEERQDRFVAYCTRERQELCITIQRRVGRNIKELTVTENELLGVIDKSKNWWKVHNIDGVVGHVPYTIVDLYQQPSSSINIINNNTTTNNNNNNINNHSNSKIGGLSPAGPALHRNSTESGGPNNINVSANATSVSGMGGNDPSDVPLWAKRGKRGEFRYF